MDYSYSGEGDGGGLYYQNHQPSMADPTEGLGPTISMTDDVFDNSLYNNQQQLNTLTPNVRGAGYNGNNNYYTTNDDFFGDDSGDDPDILMIQFLSALFSLLIMICCFTTCYPEVILSFGVFKVIAGAVALLLGVPISVCSTAFLMGALYIRVGWAKVEQRQREEQEEMAQRRNEDGDNSSSAESRSRSRTVGPSSSDNASLMNLAGQHYDRVFNQESNDHADNRNSEMELATLSRNNNNNNSNQKHQRETTKKKGRGLLSSGQGPLVMMASSDISSKDNSASHVKADSTTNDAIPTTSGQEEDVVLETFHDEPEDEASPSPQIKEGGTK